MTQWSNPWCTNVSEGGGCDGGWPPCNGYNNWDLATPNTNAGTFHMYSHSHGYWTWNCGQDSGDKSLWGGLHAAWDFYATKSTGHKITAPHADQTSLNR